MTRQDFELLATVLGECDAASTLVFRVAAMCERHNASFDRKRFFLAVDLARPATKARRNGTNNLKG